MVYLPAGYAEASRGYPVICLLHGRGDTMYGWQTIKPDLDPRIGEGAIPPFIAVLPDVQASKGASYRTITARSGRAIAGYSIGGYGAVRYPLAHPELFSAGIILSPAVFIPLPPVDSSARFSGAFGQGEQVFVEEIYSQFNCPALIPEFEKSQL